MPTERFGLTSSVVDGTIYAIGGSQARDHYLPTVEVYDPATDSWVSKADMPVAVCWHSTSEVDGKIYVIGGGTAEDLLKNVWEYDPATDTWTEKGPMPSPRAMHSTSVVNGRIYVFGAVLSEGRALTDEYDPATDTWDEKAPMPTPRILMSTSVVDGIIYAIGGGDQVHSPGLTTVEAYDPATDTWSTKAPIPTARGFFSTSVVNGKIYAVGGSAGYMGYETLISNTVEVFDPVTNTWAVGAELSIPRGALTTSTVNGKLYAIGGDLYSALNFLDPSSLVEELTVAPSEYPHVYWLDVAANLAGSHGSQWVTDLVLFNEAETAADISFVLHGEDGQHTAPASVVPGAQGVFEDVVGSSLGLQGKGLLEVRSSNPLRGAARIYNLATEGTFGQGFALHAAEEGLTAGDTAYLLELRQQRNRYRTNIAVANTGDVDAEVQITLLATDGSELHAFTLDLEPGELVQDIEPFAKRAGRPDLGWGLARAEVITGSGVLVSASVIDSRTNDATTVLMQR
jgi:N-acetylneuraminic acid mutarotase